MTTNYKNYSLRKCYLEKDQVPTQTVMNNMMNPSLATVYFKSMTPKLKVVAGLEPPLKGGGYDWYAPPEDLLKGRTVLKPLKKVYLKKLGYNGFVCFGDIIFHRHLKSQQEQKSKAVLENDEQWKMKIENLCKTEYEDLCKKAVHINTEKCKQAFLQFTALYNSSINKIENILLSAARKEINDTREEVYSKMSNRYKTLIKQQATMLYDKYTERLEKINENSKVTFISKMEQLRMELGNKVHDINVQKHVAIEKLRQMLECQNLACQIYVAMKEKDENEKIMNQSTYKHKKTLHLLTEIIDRNEIQIQSQKEKEQKLNKLDKIWKEKVSQVVKKFQEFIAFSLHTIPEQADFLLNIEKLLMLQISDIIDNPNAESLFEPEKEEFHTPVPELRPFYLFCDEGSKPQIKTQIRLKPFESSTSQLPVIVINKKCIYATCDNPVEFADKVEQFVDVQNMKKLDLNNSDYYINDIPVKYSLSQQILDLKEQSSVMQILQKELPNPNNVTTECYCPCNLPFCFCLPSEDPISIIPEEKRIDPIPALSSPKQETSTVDESMHRREPKWESYFKFMEPKNCKCSKRVKKGLEENLPAYMTKMSAFEYPELPNYEPCSLTTLKKIVRRAKAKSKCIVKPKTSEPSTRDVATEYSDQEFEFLCTCLDEKQATTILNQIMQKHELYPKVGTGFNVDGCLSTNHLNETVESFVKDRALSLRNLITDSPELIEIFKKR